MIQADLNSYNNYVILTFISSKKKYNQRFNKIITVESSILPYFQNRGYWVCIHGTFELIKNMLQE